MWINLTPCHSDSSWDHDWVPRNHPAGPETSWRDLKQEAFIWFNFEVEIEWVLGGFDLSWSGRGVPALDWAMMLNWVPSEILRVGECRPKSSNMDFWYSFTRRGDEVAVEASYTSVVAKVHLRELDALATAPVFQAFQLITKFHPEALQSQSLKNTLTRVLDTTIAELLLGHLATDRHS